MNIELNKIFMFIKTIAQVYIFKKNHNTICHAHPKTIEGFKNFELLFLPPNTRSKIQPCDAGIIRALKMHYHLKFYHNLLESYEVEKQI